MRMVGMGIGGWIWGRSNGWGGRRVGRESV